MCLNHPETTPSMGRSSSMKRVPGAKKAGARCRGALPLGEKVRMHSKDRRRRISDSLRFRASPGGEEKAASPRKGCTVNLGQHVTQ